MKPFHIAVVCSLLFHVLIVLLLGRINVPEKKIKYLKFDISLMNEPPAIIEKPLVTPPAPRSVFKQPTEPVIKDLEKESFIEPVLRPEKVAAQDTVKQSVRERLFALQPQFHFQNFKDTVKTSNRFNADLLTNSGNKAPNPALINDQIEQNIKKQQTGHDQTVDVPYLLFKGLKAVKEKILPKNTNPELDFFPDEKEMQAMSVIYEKGEVSDLDIFAQFDTTGGMTRSELDIVLNKLVDKRFLEKKQISPKNEFTLLTPIGAKKIEMSRTNRRNRIFIYSAKLPKDVLQDFLNAIYFQNQNGEKLPVDVSQDSSEIAKKVEKLLYTLTNSGS